ncbi:tRNA pseudouridine(55) synthase TruB [bacterium]|nr:tRNA pseudouridine(55) synthase TruB [bacterium]MDY3757035.1 tRNA pseudouridine(55) synthase TruB [Bacilli bacterium]
MKTNNMQGAIIVNKAPNMTSRDVINILNKKFNTKSIGHIGTLDPIAEGVLVCLIGKYTKLTDILINHDKEYIASFKLGILTDTLDITGKILKEEKVNLTKEEIQKTILSFKGTYNQEVPIYSAVKINGKKLYEYARNNEEITLPKREVNIYDIELLNIDNECLTIKTKVSKGTYIRSLIRDIGLKLNTNATMTKLIRTKLDKFTIEESYTLEDIQNDNYKILSLEDLIDLDTININEEMLFKIKNGQIIDYQTNKYILYKYNNQNIALYKPYQNNKIKPFIMF